MRYRLKREQPGAEERIPVPMKYRTILQYVRLPRGYEHLKRNFIQESRLGQELVDLRSAQYSAINDAYDRAREAYYWKGTPYPDWYQEDLSPTNIYNKMNNGGSLKYPGLLEQFMREAAEERQKNRRTKEPTHKAPRKLKI